MLLSLAAPLSLLAILLIGFGVDAAVWTVVTLLTSLLFSALGLRVYLRRALPPKIPGSIGFFHPFANSGGGGERVLWCAIQAVEHHCPNAKVFIYVAAGGPSAEELVANAAKRFNINICGTVQVVPLARWQNILPEHHPSFTLLFQSLAFVPLTMSALKQRVPETFIDTSGCALAYPLVRLAGAKVACYVHYPIVSTDMLQRVMARQSIYNNSRDVADSLAKSLGKLAYYYIFAALYGAAGACANVVMVNSTWTREHICQLWWKLEAPVRVYPPCNTDMLAALPLDRKLKRLYLISVAQFRPEKDHAMQLRAFALARQRAALLAPQAGSAVLAASLKLAGSCRGPADEAHVEQLMRMRDSLGLAGCVQFCLNVPYASLEGMLGEAVGGLHTMVDEHFGISVVESMAAGVIPIVNNSGGPRTDIVDPGPGAPGISSEEAPMPRPPQTGYLCTTEDEYAEAIAEVLAMDQANRLRIAAAARKKALRFSDARFEADFLAALQPALSVRLLIQHGA